VSKGESETMNEVDTTAADSIDPAIRVVFFMKILKERIPP
jgi:hypothetical protein